MHAFRPQCEGSPGEMVFTLIPSFPNSHAKFLAICRTADLDVLYATQGCLSIAPPTISRSRTSSNHALTLG